MLRHLPARPEQPQSPTIIRDALRAAALAPSDRDALDVLGAALVNLIDAARAAEAVLTRGRWIEGSTDPEAVALWKLRTALGIRKEVRHA